MPLRACAASRAAMPGEALIAGYFRFRRGAWLESRARFAALAEGQSPRGDRKSVV